TGAKLSDRLVEKDVTLAIARRLRAELVGRGLSAYLVRDGDTTLSLDQRAMAANAAKPALYLAIHAGALGRGVRIYSAMLSTRSDASGTFLPWETAQAGNLLASRNLAAVLVQSLEKEQSKFPVSIVPAPVRPLNNVVSPALAVEIAPKGSDVETLNNAAYQQTVVSALANAIASARPQLEAV